MLYCVPLLAQFVIEQGMEEQRLAELRWGLTFQVGAGDEVWVVRFQETKGI